MAGALDVSVVAGLARCAHDLTSVPMQIVADTCIAAAESCWLALQYSLSQHGLFEVSTTISGIST